MSGCRSQQPTAALGPVEKDTWHQRAAITDAPPARASGALSSPSPACLLLLRHLAPTTPGRPLLGSSRWLESSPLGRLSQGGFLYCLTQCHLSHCDILKDRTSCEGLQLRNCDNQSTFPSLVSFLMHLFVSLFSVFSTQMEDVEGRVHV